MEGVQPGTAPAMKIAGGHPLGAASKEVPSGRVAFLDGSLWDSQSVSYARSAADNPRRSN